jgi:tetratricopeptide (TPR) repeat protein
LERAVELDSAYALAYVGLADCYSFLAYFEWFAPREMAGKAKIAVEKALELAPGLAECHMAMATFKLFFEFDFAAAEHEYLAAISISPNLPQAHYLYCSALAATGRLDDAISEGQIAVSLDPISPLANMTLSRALCYAGRPEEAVERIERSLEIAPELWFLHWMLGVAYGQTGQLDRSIDHFREAAAVGGLRIYSYLGEALIRGGRPDEARRLLDELNTSYGRLYLAHCSRRYRGQFGKYVAGP